MTFSVHTGGAKTIEGPNGESAFKGTHVDAALVTALAQAFQWREQFVSGTAETIQEIAESSGCNESHIRHRIDLAFLPPDIIEAILYGRQPRHITLDRLIATDLPLSWDKQRAVLGYSAR